MKKVVVFVGGVRLVLHSDNSEEYMKYIASKADGLIKSVKRSSPVLPTDKAALLALINSLDRHEGSQDPEQAAREDQLHIESLEAQLESARHAISEMKNVLASYEEREKLMEAGLELLQAANSRLEEKHDPELSARTLTLIHADPDQISFRDMRENRRGAEEAIS